MYKFKYDWNQPCYYNLSYVLKSLYTKIDSNVNQTYKNELMNDLEEFVFQAFKTRIINSDTMPAFIDSLSKITTIGELPPNQRGIFGITYSKTNIYMNPDLDRWKRRLYFFHELAHATIVRLNNQDMRAFANNFYQNLKSMNPYAQIPNTIHESEVTSVYYGWRAIEECLAQEVAENFAYSSVNLSRPRPTSQTDKIFNNQIRFQSNVDYYGLFQALTNNFGRFLNNGNNISDQQMLYNLCIRSTKPNFVRSIISECSSDSKKYNEFYNILYSFGQLTNAKHFSFGYGLFNPRPSVSNTQKIWLAVNELMNKKSHPLPSTHKQRN